jgi:hypothetical protein
MACTLESNRILANFNILQTYKHTVHIHVYIIFQPKYRRYQILSFIIEKVVDSKIVVDFTVFLDLENKVTIES